jgi:uridine kinase
MCIRKRCFVIAIAGASGAGKSTLVKELVRELEDALAISFDDYHPGAVSSTNYPKDLEQSQVIYVALSESEARHAG